MKIIRVSTVPESINLFYKGFLSELREEGYEIVVVSSPQKDLAEIEQREGVRTTGVTMSRNISIFKDISSLVKLIKVFRKEKPDMVHSITPKAGLLSMMAAWVCRVPVRLHTFTGLVFPTSTGLKKRILIVTDKITCACATHINPEGEGVRNDLRQFKITNKPLTILGHGNIKGIDSEWFNPNNTIVDLSQCSDFKDKFNFIFIGRIVRDKGVKELIEAFCKVHDQYPKAQLLMVGDFEQNHDPLDEHTLECIESHPAIRFIGFQKDIRPYLNVSQVCILPSYREGFPNVVLEAGAMGVPSIVTDINGSREIIRDGYNGLMVPPHDCNALYRAMVRLIENPNELSLMREVIRDSILSRFEQSFVRNELKKYYRTLLKGLSL